MSATITDTRSLQSGTWDIDPIHSRIGFEVKHLGISTFRGRFNHYKGRIVTSAGHLSGVDGTIEVGSIDVEDAQLAGHLGSEDFLPSIGILRPVSPPPLSRGPATGATRSKAT